MRGLYDTFYEEMNEFEPLSLPWITVVKMKSF